ncbi:GNAT family N-acetyltransferase [Trichlorobacter ammonificans]|uniref:UDP-4-amino-4, 6-dideoxy-N-acetyl-beta-L-altrosamine N-acetyltransferase n=1 Tax=Trichlorobacter ammonificans TaxID=2916410 RepID=A0ABM9D807_9BACT|nr:GNAT family protein [Trichlorobacter ammonificans]CAH2031351.1 UDP-4-amino-4, 6-dideoxy-N-acetyl-beta-L-altrosamine N-acetyltransferase [Trichlorobacter ammonificans]
MHEPVYLRALESSDVALVHTWHNDRNLYELLGGPFHFVSRHAVETWLDRKTCYAAPSDEISLAICVVSSDKHVGNIYLRHIDWIARHAEMQVLIGDTRERSKGYGSSALRQILAYAFNDLGLNRIYLYVLTDNKVAIASYERMGFCVEGTLRSHVFKQGGWKDALQMGICAADFTATVNSH